MIDVLGIGRSLSGRAWRWRGGICGFGGEIGDGSQSAGGLDDLVTQLLLARGVQRDDLARNKAPTLRAFLPDPSLFRDMDVAAERLARAVTTNVLPAAPSLTSASPEGP